MQDLFFLQYTDFVVGLGFLRPEHQQVGSEQGASKEFHLHSYNTLQFPAFANANGSIQLLPAVLVFVSLLLLLFPAANRPRRCSFFLCVFLSATHEVVGVPSSGLPAAQLYSYYSGFLLAFPLKNLLSL